MTADDLAAAVETKVAALQAELLAKVDANLSGAMLQERSGALKASILASIVADADTFGATLTSVGVPYAAIQEYGGTTAPHDIVPVKARALAFAGAGGIQFARRVHHPGSVIPSRPYMGAALEALQGEIAVGLKAAVCAALGAS